MDDPFEHPPFTLSVVWHPAFVEGQRVADHLFSRFRADPFQSVARGVGLPISFHSQPERPGGEVPRSVSIDSHRCQAVILLLEEQLQRSLAGPWGQYIAELVDQVEATREASLLFPVAFSRAALAAHPRLSATNFIRWYDWYDTPVVRLTTVLTHELCRLIAPWVATIEAGREGPPDLEELPEPVRVFISHSKHDGERLAETVRGFLHQGSLKSFFDAYDIPPGRSFEKQIRGQIKRSAVLVVHTDSYASREWCRLELLTARRYEVPVVVLNAVQEGEVRAFPYGGNVPVVMARGLGEERVAVAIDRLLDEYLKALYWRLQRPFLEAALPGALILPRAPDLLNLVTNNRPVAVVHPDPPLGLAESTVLRELIPDLRLETPTSLFVAQP